jgi:hypothetical protein
MAKIATLIDDFQDGTIDLAKWNVIGTVTESGGRARLTPTSTYSYLTSTATYDLTDSQLIAHVPTATANGSTGTLESTLLIQDAFTNRAGIRKRGANIECVKYVSGVFTIVYTFAYNPATHIFWRLRESGGIFYWDVSAAGASWTNLFNTTVATNLFPVSNVIGGVYAGWAAGSEAFPGTMQVEAINPGLPLAASGASTSTGNLDLLTTAPNEISASGASTSTGSLAFTLVLPGAVDIVFAGASTSTGFFQPIALAPGIRAIVASGASTSSGSLDITIPSTDPPIMPGGTWYFEPPIAYDLPPTLPEPTRPRWINAHAKWKGGQRRGRTVLKRGDIYTIVDTPTVDEMAAADIAYQGGHIYTISAEEAYALSQLGFNVYHEVDLLTTEDGDFITTESGDLITVEYSFGPS